MKLEELAYETGVHLGDGCPFVDKPHRTYKIEFSGDSRNDKEFYSRIFPEIFKRVHGRNLKIYKRKNENTIIAILNSKEVAERKISLGLPCGNKLKLGNIPALIDRNLVSHFIRGLADSDFSVSFKKNKNGVHCEPRIEFFTNNKILADFVFENLKNLKFNPALEETSRRGFKEFRIRIYGKKMLNNWMEKIGFQNPKHLAKVYLFKNMALLNQD